MTIVADLLDQARVRIGLVSGDTSKDAELTAALTLAQQAVEMHLGRQLDLQTEVIELEGGQTTALLTRFPVTVLNSVQIDGVDVPSSSYKLKAYRGVLILNFLTGTNPALTVSYTGGYATANALPAAILAVIWSVFGRQKAQFLSPPASTFPNQEIKTLQSPDIGTITYFSTSETQRTSSGFLTLADVNVLALYRAESAIGAG